MSDLLNDVFAFLESINVTKQNLMVTEQDETRYERCRWMLLRALSFSKELVPAVNLINATDMSARMEYEFFLNFIPVGHRRPKWPKKSAPSLYLESVQRYYGYSETKAVQAMKLLSIEQLAMIEKRIRKEDESWETSSGGTGSK